MDVAAFVVGIPSTVEGFVKTARTVLAYKGIEAKHAERIKDAIYYAEKLRYLSHFIDGASLDSKSGQNPSRQSSSHNKIIGNASASFEVATEVQCAEGDSLNIESQRILYDVFQNATSALNVAQKVVLEWAVRLGQSNSSASRLLVAKLALSLSDRLVTVTDNQGKKSSLSQIRNKTMLLAIGCDQIKDAVGRLKHWLTELHDILLASPKLHLRISLPHNASPRNPSDGGDDLLFVVIARERERRLHAVRWIKCDLLTSVRSLEHRRSDLLLVEEGPFEGCLIDRRNISHFLEQGKEAQVLGDTERIVRLFAEEHDDLGHSITASVGVLPCCGFSTSEQEYHDLVFRLPPNSRKPRSLRSLLLEEPRHALDERLELSIKLSSAVLIVHSLGLLHKDIRPDSIILVESILTQDSILSPQRLGEPYLVAFNESRSQSSRTVPLSQAEREARSKLWASLYRHPRHLSTRLHLPFETRDDIYSLGICLLEIAIWKSLFVWNEEKEVFECDKSVLDFTDGKYIDELARTDEPAGRVRPGLRWRDIKRFAEEKVPVTMGTAFKDVVVKCLTFGEEKPAQEDMPQRQQTNQEFLQNQSVNFVKYVLTRLRDLKLH